MSFGDVLARVVQNASVAVLGGAIVYRPKGGGEGREIRGIWSSPYMEFEGERGIAVAARRPTLDVSRSDVVACFGKPPSLDDEIDLDDGVLGPLTYIVNSEPEGDGQGMIVLHLRLKG